MVTLDYLRKRLIDSRRNLGEYSFAQIQQEFDYLIARMNEILDEDASSNVDINTQTILLTGIADKGHVRLV